MITYQIYLENIVAEINFDKGSNCSSDLVFINFIREAFYHVKIIIII